jgi:hypothetical protein
MQYFSLLLAMQRTEKTCGLPPETKHVIKAYNANRKKNVAASKDKCGDESISEWKPRATKTADLPNIHSNRDKPKDMGTENNTVFLWENRGNDLH